jgi:hypothetical protein
VFYCNASFVRSTVLRLYILFEEGAVVSVSTFAGCLDMIDACWPDVVFLENVENIDSVADGDPALPNSP